MYGYAAQFKVEMNISRATVLTLLFSLLLPALAGARGIIDVAIVVQSPIESEPYSYLVDLFEAENPGYSVILHARNDKSFKQKLPEWLAKSEMDVVFWQAGERLYEYARASKVVSLDKIWETNRLDSYHSPTMKQLVSLNDKVYGLPVTKYNWGFFYNQALFASLNLQPPTTIPELIAVCSTLREQGIPPMLLGARDQWPTLAWFDYINIRMNGLAFHRRTLKGEISFQSEEIIAVFELWQSLLAHCPFNTDYQQKTWDQPISALTRGKAGMMLMGNFLQHKLFPAQLQKLGYFSFPEIKKEHNSYEIVPTDIVMISSNSNNQEGAKAFVRFLTQSDVLQKYNQRLSHPLITQGTYPEANHLTQAAVEQLKKSKGVSQYFDRAAPSYLAEAALDYLNVFISTKDIITVTKALEKVRVSKQYSPDEPHQSNQ